MYFIYKNIKTEYSKCTKYNNNFKDFFYTEIA